MTLLLMLNMLASSTMTTEVNAVEAPADASSETITKIAQDAISGSTPTKQSNSVIQKKKGSSEQSQTTMSSESSVQPPETTQMVALNNEQSREAGLGTVKARIDSTDKTLYLSGGVLPDKVADDYGNSPWVFPNSPFIDQIEHISIDGEISAKDIFNLFHGLKKLKTVQGLGNIKGATNFGSLFNGDSLLESVDATNLDFSNATSVANMFNGCWALTTVGDSSAWQLGHVTNMSNFFSDAHALTSLNTDNWDTSQVTNMSKLFFNAKALTNLNVSNWDVSKVTNLEYTFYGCGSLLALDVANWQTSQVTTLANTFGNYKGKTLDIARWDTAKVVSMDSTFNGVENAQLDVSHWQTGNVQTMNRMFRMYRGGNLDVSNWDTHQVTIMSGMFWGSWIDHLASDNWDTSQVTNMESMFREATKLTSVGTANWDTSQVQTLNTFLYQATALPFLDLSNWDTTQVTDMYAMLSKDTGLSHLKLGPNVRLYDTKGVFAALPEPSTETPYFGRWQRHDVNDQPVGENYTSADLMSKYDGMTVPTGDYYWAVATPPTITKLVRNVTADGDNAPFKTATTAQKGDIVEYQVNITQPSGQKLDRGAIFEDVLDSHLKLDSSKGLMIAYATAGSDFDMFQLINFNDQWQFATGQTMEIGQKAQVKIKATVADDGVPEIDNLFKLVSGSYGAGTTSNTAIVHVKKPLTLTKAVKNETTNTNWATKQDVSPGDQVGFSLDYQNTTGTTSNQVTFNDPLVTTELTYQTGSLKVTYQDGTTETVSDAAQTQFATTGKLTLTKSLANYEAVKLNFSATVNPLVTSGTTLHNKATVTADNVSQPVTSNTVDMNVIQSEHQLTIRYVDLDEDLSQPASAGTQIAAPITVTGKTGTALSTLLPGQQVAPKVIDGYTIYSVSEDPDLKPENWQKAYRDDPQIGDQDRIITYGYKKAMLSIDAPSSWEFGDYNNKSMDRTYYLNDNHGTPQAVTVTDNYGVQNWQLQVSQAKPFVDDDQHELTDAKWLFSNGNIKTLSNTGAGTVTNNSDHFTLVPGQTATLMTMTKSGHFQSDSPDTSDRDNPYTQVGQGQWAYRFGDEQSADYSIGLNVPATTKRYTGHYRTKLTWSLSVGP